MKRIVVIGAGPAGIEAALTLANHGENVTIVTDRQVGDWKLSSTAYWLKLIGKSDEGISIKNVKKDVEQLNESWSNSITALLEEQKVNIVIGKASIISPNEMIVRNDIHEQRLSADYLDCLVPRDPGDFGMADVIHILQKTQRGRRSLFAQDSRGGGAVALKKYADALSGQAGLSSMIGDPSPVSCLLPWIIAPAADRQLPRGNPAHPPQSFQNRVSHFFREASERGPFAADQRDDGKRPSGIRLGDGRGMVAADEARSRTVRCRQRADSTIGVDDL